MTKGIESSSFSGIDDSISVTNSTNHSRQIIDSRNESLANIEILVLSIILFVAILGNGVMLIALRRQLLFRPMSRMYFFMMNLSIADVLVAFGNILPQLAWDITFRFKGTDALCRLVKFLQIFVLYLSSFVLTSMALDRYLVVCHHTFSRNHYTGLKGPKVMITISWILSLILASPQAIIFSLTEIEPGVIDCWSFLSPLGEKTYVTWFVISVFILPLVVVGLSYGAICFKVISFTVPGESRKTTNPTSTTTTNGNRRYCKRSRGADNSFSSSLGHGDSENTDSIPIQKGFSGNIGSRALKKQISQAKVKTLKLTLVIFVCFLICWAPYSITQLIMVYNPANDGIEVAPLKVILLLLASLNSCTNPWIYLAFSESLCNQLRVLLGIGLNRGSNDESIGDEQDPPPILNDRRVIKLRVTGDLQDLKHIKSQQLLKRGGIGSDDQQHQGHLQIQPQTKSEVV